MADLVSQLILIVVQQRDENSKLRAENAGLRTKVAHLESALSVKTSQVASPSSKPLETSQESAPGAPRALSASSSGASSSAQAQPTSPAQCVPKTGWSFFHDGTFRSSFNLSQMQQMMAQGFFDAETLMRCSPMDQFTKFKLLYPDPSRAFLTYPQRPRRWVHDAMERSDESGGGIVSSVKAWTWEHTEPLQKPQERSEETPTGAPSVQRGANSTASSSQGQTVSPPNLPVPKYGWCFVRDGVRQGPFNLSHMIEQYERGMFDADTLMRCSVLAKWTTFQKLFPNTSLAFQTFPQRQPRWVKDDMETTEDESFVEVRTRKGRKREAGPSLSRTSSAEAISGRKEESFKDLDEPDQALVYYRDRHDDFKKRARKNTRS